MEDRQNVDRLSLVSRRRADGRLMSVECQQKIGIGSIGGLVECQKMVDGWSAEGGQRHDGRLVDGLSTERLLQMLVKGLPIEGRSWVDREQSESIGGR